MPTSDDSREQGVEFGQLAEDLERAEYPMTKAELLDAYGDRELDVQDGSKTLQEVLGPIGETTYDDAEAVMQGVIGMVSDQAIGRKNYTDRGGVPSEDNPDEESI
jgi:hypothetical protein